jgi:hypothetical protein
MKTWYEEVHKSPVNGEDKWRGIHSGREYADHEVEEEGQGVAFGRHYGGWNEREKKD